MIRNLIAATALLLAVPAIAQTAPAPKPAPKVTWIHAGTLLDRPGQAPRGNSTIIVRDGKIAEVRDGFVAPEAGATLVDLSKAFVLPGLIDMHVHLFSEGDPVKQRMEALTRDDGDEFVIGEENARKDLEAGFTTVRDLGSEPRQIRALRDAIDRGAVAGPGIVNAGRMISVSGGHGDGQNGRPSPGRKRWPRARSTPAMAPTIAAARCASRSGWARWRSSSRRPAGYSRTSPAVSASR